MRRPPPGLQARGRRLWRRVVDAVLDDVQPVAQELLLEACRTADVLERIDAELAGRLTVEGSQGQVRAHPLLAARSEQLKALQALLALVVPE